ncbi:protein of unknown function [Citrobacter amalonaticus]|uniref:Uncharacterized protein n=1 Tax=Citrobacter amalonaticus TaxID=35703 RepID=A0AAX2BNV0_CITAM|nr:protein of unknown function [Citrobacter amalonaticus]SBA20934.1 protein of unknown function [Citrobacter amalonaticus]
MQGDIILLINDGDGSDETVNYKKGGIFAFGCQYSVRLCVGRAAPGAL